ncbi:hypothetical protein FGB62_35g114 [Gracilaria domingensis]|nr:hypothetical protein FGB62_35g114 [Gracilaria domingensis]
MAYFKLYLSAVVFAIVLIFSLAHETLEEETDKYCNQIGEGSFNCEKYNPTACYNGKCVPELSRNSKSFDDHCTQNVCFLLKQEAPIVIIPEDRMKRKNISTPFKCKESSNRSISGSLVGLFNETVAGDLYCVWVGDDSGCTWNMMQHLVASDTEYMFSAGGPMLETPQRKCHHVPSSSWLDDRMVIVGNSSSIPTEDPWFTATNPFSTNAWICFAAIFAVHIVMFCFLGGMIHWQKVPHKAAASYFLVTGDEGNVLESNLFNESKESNLSHEYKENITRLTFLASIFRFSLKAAFLIFLIFYEAGLVNLLFFRNSSTISKRSVGSISRGKLPRYVSEFHQIEITNPFYACRSDNFFLHAFKVDPRNEISEDEELRWQEADGLKQCLNRIKNKNDPVRFAVSYEREAKHQIEVQNAASPQRFLYRKTRLEIFELEDDIYRFNSGWLFKKPEKNGDPNFTDTLSKINIGIVQNRVEGNLTEWLKDDIKPKPKKKITMSVLALCLCIFAFLPLAIAFLMLLLWGRLKFEWENNLWCLNVFQKKANRTEKGNDKKESA